MKKWIINWVNYIYAYLFQRKYIFTILISAPYYSRFAEITAGKEHMTLLGKNPDNIGTRYKVILSNKLLIK
jgi:hypothetical protein